MKTKKSNSRQHFNNIKQIVKCKRSQITIFVIIALILVVSIALIFVLIKDPGVSIDPVEDPRGNIESCIEEATEEAIELILPHGGYLVPEEPYMIYDEENVAYLCYVQGQDKICVSQEPMLIERIEEEIYNYINPRVENCFDSLEQSLRKYDYSAGATDLNVEIKPERIIIQIDKDVSFVRTGQTQNIEIFDTEINHPIYDFARITNNIINQEIDCDCGQETCNADVFTVAGTHDFEVERFVTGGNEKVYTIREVVSDIEFKFAVRNCVRLP